MVRKPASSKPRSSPPAPVKSDTKVGFAQHFGAPLTSEPRSDSLAFPFSGNCLSAHTSARAATGWIALLHIPLLEHLKHLLPIVRGLSAIVTASSPIRTTDQHHSIGML